jgi:hypothetical protein
MRGKRTTAASCEAMSSVMASCSAPLALAGELGSRDGDWMLPVPPRPAEKTYQGERERDKDRSAMRNACSNLGNRYIPGWDVRWVLGHR